MRAIRAQAGGAFITAAMGEACCVKGIDSGTGRRGEGDHAAVAGGCGLLIIGSDDPEGDAGRGGEAIADLISICVTQLMAKGGHDGIVEDFGAGQVIGAECLVQEHGGIPLA